MPLGTPHRVSNGQARIRARLILLTSADHSKCIIESCLIHNSAVPKTARLQNVHRETQPQHQSFQCSIQRVHYITPWCTSKQLSENKDSLYKLAAAFIQVSQSTNHMSEIRICVTNISQLYGTRRNNCSLT